MKITEVKKQIKKMADLPDLVQDSIFELIDIKIEMENNILIAKIDQLPSAMEKGFEKVEDRFQQVW